MFNQFCRICWTHPCKCDVVKKDDPSIRTKPIYQVLSDSRGHYIADCSQEYPSQVSGHFSSPKVAEKIMNTKFIGKGA